MGGDINMEGIEVDMEQFSKGDLLIMLHEMHKEDITFNEFIERRLKEMIERSE